MVKLLVETGSERHSTRWQRMHVIYRSPGPWNKKHLYEITGAKESQEWLQNDKNAMLVKSVYNFPDGIEIEISYKGYEGIDHFILRLDSTQEVQVREVGLGALRTYTIKGRYTIIRDFVEEKKKHTKESQKEGF